MTHEEDDLFNWGSLWKNSRFSRNSRCVSYKNKFLFNLDLGKKQSNFSIK